MLCSVGVVLKILAWSLRLVLALVLFPLQIVGLVDGPNGSDVGPNAFLHEAGKLRLIVEVADEVWG